MNSPAKFLVLLDDVPRALLFDGEQRLLGEVIEEDGFIVESLLRSASECPCPDHSMLSSVIPAPTPQQPVRFFQLR
jgi:hypothetical protein